MLFSQRPVYNVQSVKMKSHMLDALKSFKPVVEKEYFNTRNNKTTTHRHTGWAQ